MTPEEIWWDRLGKVLSDVLRADYEADWMDSGNCQVESTDDKTWITEPDALSERRMRRSCLRCPVLNECAAYANTPDEHGNKPSQVYLAGEWRE